MEQTTKTLKTTTIAVDLQVRDYIADEATRQGLSQRQMLTVIVKAYRHQQENPEKQKEDDRVISFLLKLEERILEPILKAVQLLDSRYKYLIDILKKME